MERFRLESMGGLTPVGPIRTSMPSLSPSASIPGLGEALREHFDRSPIGILLLGNDRRIIAANVASVVGACPTLR